MGSLTCILALLFSGSWFRILLRPPNLVRASGVPNFWGQRIPIKSDLNVLSWRQHLCDYFDQQLVDLIQYGFSLSFDRILHLLSTFKNHASVVEFASHVDQYIADE